MIGNNTLELCEAEMCRLLALALSRHIFTQPTGVTAITPKREAGGNSFCLMLTDSEAAPDLAKLAGKEGA